MRFCVSSSARVSFTVRFANNDRTRVVRHGATQEWGAIGGERNVREGRDQEREERSVVRHKPKTGKRVNRKLPKQSGRE